MKKNRLFACACVLVALALVAGCSSAPPADPTQAAQPSQATGLTTSPPVSAGLVPTIYEDVGLTFGIPAQMMEAGAVLESPNENMEHYPIVDIFFYSPHMNQEIEKLLDIPNDEMTQEIVDAFYGILAIESKRMLNVTLVPEDAYEKAAGEGKAPQDICGFDNASELGRQGGYVYILATPDADLTGMTQEGQGLYAKCKEYLPDVVANLRLSTLKRPEERGTMFPETIPAFSAQDLAGNTVTEEIFADYQLTMVNIWGTFCGPCIDEMPDLGELSRSMPEGAQIVGLICDIQGDTNLQAAKNIVAKANAEFTHIIAEEVLLDFISGVTGVPTTFFVDGSGRIVGEPMVGSARAEDYRAAIEGYLP